VAIVRETDADLIIADEPLDSPAAMHLIELHSHSGRI